MKKLSALLLAAALLFSLIPFAGAAFTDADEIAKKDKEAVDYVSEQGVISGFPDGSFRPKENLTRAQAAKILCVMLEGAEKANALTKTETGFSDVAQTHWAAKYIAFCVDKGIVAGVGSGKFDPDGKLTAVAFAKMLLVAYGVGNAEDLVGPRWLTNTRIAIRAKGLDQNVDSLADAATTRVNACLLAYNFLQYDEIMKVEPEAYKEITLDLTDASKYRLLGRAVQTDKGVICDCSADGVEFSVECKGVITITANSSWKGGNDITYRVIVDGVPGDQVKVTRELQDFQLSGQLRVQPGLHTIRIVKDYEMTQSTDLLKSVELNCKPETIKPTQPKKKLLHIIGDSTSAGFGIVATDTPETTRNSASAVYTYGYKAAEELGMDYEMIVKGTTGLVKKYGSSGATPCDQRQLYEFQNPYRDAEKHYPFTRKADAVVMKLSNNDNSESDADVEAALREQIENIRKHNGSKIPIVLLYFTSYKHIEVAEKFINSDPLIYFVNGAHDGKGMGKHASAASHEIMTERVVEVLKPLVGN